MDSIAFAKENISLIRARAFFLPLGLISDTFTENVFARLARGASAYAYNMFPLEFLYEEALAQSIAPVYNLELAINVQGRKTEHTETIVAHERTERVIERVLAARSGAAVPMTEGTEKRPHNLQAHETEHTETMLTRERTERVIERIRAARGGAAVPVTKRTEKKPHDMQGRKVEHAETIVTREQMKRIIEQIRAARGRAAISMTEGIEKRTQRQLTGRSLPVKMPVDVNRQHSFLSREVTDVFLLEHHFSETLSTSAADRAIYPRMAKKLPISPMRYGMVAWEPASIALPPYAGKGEWGTQAFTLTHNRTDAIQGGGFAQSAGLLGESGLTGAVTKEFVSLFSPLLTGISAAKAAASAELAESGSLKTAEAEQAEKLQSVSLHREQGGISMENPATARQNVAAPQMERDVRREGEDYVTSQATVTHIDGGRVTTETGEYAQREGQRYTFKKLGNRLLDMFRGAALEKPAAKPLMDAKRRQRTEETGEKAAQQEHPARQLAPAPAARADTAQTGAAAVTREESSPRFQETYPDMVFAQQQPESPQTDKQGEPHTWKEHMPGNRPTQQPLRTSTQSPHKPVDLQVPPKAVATQTRLERGSRDVPDIEPENSTAAHRLSCMENTKIAGGQNRGQSYSAATLPEFGAQAASPVDLLHPATDEQGAPEVPPEIRRTTQRGSPAHLLNPAYLQHSANNSIALFRAIGRRKQPLGAKVAHHPTLGQMTGTLSIKTTTLVPHMQADSPAARRESGVLPTRIAADTTLHLSQPIDETHAEQQGTLPLGLSGRMWAHGEQTTPNTIGRRIQPESVGELSYILPGAVNVPAAGAVQQKTAGSEGMSLPQWASDFFAENANAPPTKAKLQGRESAMSAAVHRAQPAPVQKVWTAPGYVPATAKLAHKEKESPPQAVPVRISDAEINRLAKNVYSILEDRLARDLRRMGL